MSTRKITFSAPIKRGTVVVKPVAPPVDVESDSELDCEDLDMSNLAIATREDLKEKIHEIHNFLRNNGVGYGMNALKVFNLFYGLARIEEKDLFDHVGLDKSCKFSTLVELSKSENINGLSSKVNEFQQLLLESKVEKYILFEIPRNITDKTLAHLIIEVDNLLKSEKTLNMQLAGKLYEYFVGRDKSAISEMGAYFTDRHIVGFIYSSVIDVKLDSDNTVQTMIDPFGGSGGFTIGYISNLIKKFPDLDWSKNLNAVFHYDMNDDVVKYAGLEFMCLTQHTPNMGVNLKCQNTFTNSFLQSDNKTQQKFKYIITNPPYGGDKRVKSSALLARQRLREKLLEQIGELEDDSEEPLTDESKAELIQKKHKQLKILKKLDLIEEEKFQQCKVSVENSSPDIKRYAKKYKLDGNDKEATSLILMMCLLDVKGTAVGVLKEGVFFDKKYTKLRNPLIEKFNVISVHDVDAKQFENTTTKTSIIRFDNTGKTKKINFYKLEVNKYEEDLFGEDINGNLAILQQKGEIKDLTAELTATATFEQLAEHKFSLNAKNYELEDAEEVKCPDGYKLVTLDELCEIELGKRIVKEKIIAGEYPVYGGGYQVYTYEKYNRDGLTCKIARFAVSLENCVQLISGKFWLNDGGLSLKYTDEKYKTYVNNWLLNNKDKIYALSTGSIQKGININQLKKLQIPVPDDDTLLETISKRLSEPYDAKIQSETELRALEEKVSAKVAEIAEKEQCDEYKLGDICEMKNGFAFGEKDFDSTKSLVVGENYPLIQNGVSIKNYINIRHPKAEQSSAVRGDVLICTWGRVDIKLVDFDKVCHRKDIFKVTQLEICSNHYLYYYLLATLKDIESMSSGSIVKGINSKDVKTISVKIPKNKKVLDKLQLEFNKIEELKQKIKEYDGMYNEVVKEVFSN
jgi:restriction endonuclease S subunit